MAMLFVTVVEKLASSPSAAASSFNVFKALGELSTKFEIAVSV